MGQLRLACRELLPKCVHVEPGLARLCEQAFEPFLFFLDVVLDFLGEHLHLGVVEFVIRAPADDLGDQHLGAVMLDIGFLEQVLVDLAFARRIENLFFDLGVDRKLETDLFGELALALIAVRLFELLEQLLDRAMISLQQRNRVLVLALGHTLTPSGFGPRNQWPLSVVPHVQCVAKLSGSPQTAG